MGRDGSKSILNHRFRYISTPSAILGQSQGLKLIQIAKNSFPKNACVASSFCFVYCVVSHGKLCECKILLCCSSVQPKQHLNAALSSVDHLVFQPKVRKIKDVLHKNVKNILHMWPPSKNKYCLVPREPILNISTEDFHFI